MIRQPNRSSAPFGAIHGVVLVVCLLAFVGIGWFAEGPSTLEIDQDSMQSVQELAGEPWHTAADLGNYWGSTPATPIVLALLGIIAIRIQSVRLAALLLVTGGLRYAASVLKPWFDSPRPNDSQALIRGDFGGLGFPSGHSMTSTVIACVTTVVLVRYVRDVPAIAPLLTLVWVMVPVTMFARIWSGAHWTTDTLGGFLVGVLIVGVASLIARLNLQP